MLKALHGLFQGKGTALDYGNEWELMVAVQLSAQCTDKRVNLVTKELFKKYKTLDDYVRAKSSAFEQDIRSTGFYRNKARNILAAAKAVKERHGGILPNTMSALVALPGVGRKTANVVLGNIHKSEEGIPVDTHVRRFSIRFDLSDFKDPVRIERDLLEIVPPKERFFFAGALIEYGREICPARRHDCKDHPLTKVYPWAVEVWPKAH